jgi:indolepyruvate ferredoxin oxidoreductase, beta subunit
MTSKNIILAGVGGHGIITLTNIISYAALSSGLNVKQTETLGFAQREGSVYAHLRYSHEKIYSCTIPDGEVDLIIGTEPGETYRYLSLLKSNGTIITSTNSFPKDVSNIYDLETVLAKIKEKENSILINAQSICRKVNANSKSANLAVLGTASTYLGIADDLIRRTICQAFSGKNLEKNLSVYELGKKQANEFDN